MRGLRHCRTLIALLFIAAVTLLPHMSARAWAQGAGTTPPPLGPPHPLILPTVVQQTLPNGLKLVLLEDHRQPALWLRLSLPAGSIRDPQDRVGLAAMTASLLNEGAGSRTADQIADLVDGIGANLGASAGDDTLTVSARGLSAYSDTLFSLLADITLRPTFPKEELERARNQTLNDLNFSLSQPETMAGIAIDRLVYGAHPYGNLSTGTPKTLAAITQDDLKRFHDTYFAPNVATLFLVGDITAAQAQHQALAAFGSWARKELPPAPAPPLPPATTGKPQITLIDRPGAAQTQIRIGALTSGYSDPNRTVATLATVVLGAGNFEGRLNQEIREKRGLAYGASSFISRNRDAGAFEITTFTKNASTGEVIQLALEEAHKIATVDVPSQELADRKSYYQGEFAISVATPDGLLARLVPAVLYGNGPADLTTLTDKIGTVTPDQIRAVMGALNLSAPQIVLVGDAKAILDQVKPLGDVRVIPFDSVDLLSPTLQAPGVTTTTGVGQAPTATAEELAAGKARMEAVIKAHGGDAFLNLKTLRAKGKGAVTPPGGQLAAKLNVEMLTLALATPDRVRIELTTGFGDITLGVPGGSATPWLNALGSVQDLPADVSALIPLFNPGQLLGQAQAKNYAIRALPDTEDGKPITADGKPLQGFAITDDRGNTTEVYADPQTNLVRRLAVRSPKGDPLVVSMGDYHVTDGMQFPGTVRAAQGANTLFDFTFTSFEVNKPLDATLFARPQ
jgi:zinc protease